MFQSIQTLSSRDSILTYALKSFEFSHTVLLFFFFKMPLHLKGEETVTTER